MAALRMKPVTYTGEVWEGQAVHPDLWNLLLEKDLLIEITSGEPPFDLVLGIPHHSAPGVDRIAGDWQNPKNGKMGRPADETTGLTGLAVLSALREKNLACKLVIAAHPTDHDPNKTPGCQYWASIFTPPLPKLLFELHGAASHRRHALELSAGNNPISEAERFGRVLAYFLSEDPILAVQTRPGSSEALIFKDRQETGGRLQNPALETRSLIEAGQLGIPGLHLEIKSSFRQPDPAFPGSPQPGSQARALARSLADTFELISRPDDINISAARLGLPSTAILIRPSMEYAGSYLDATRETPLDEMNDNPELRIFTKEDAETLIEDTRRLLLYGMPAHPPEEYLWLVDQGEFIGRVFFLHWLNAFRLKTDGQVDYWIRPSKRQQGYGRLILRLLLERYRQLGTQRVLITCNTTNLPSQKIIEANGGVFDGLVDVPDSFGFPRDKKRYWIEVH